MANEKTLILNNEQIDKTIRRMAYEIVERNYNEQHIVLAGIVQRGNAIMEMLSKEIEKISGNIKVESCEIHLNSPKPNNINIEVKPAIQQLEKKVLVIVDDVSNTGKALFYGMHPFIKENPLKIQTAVLVDRDHRTVPIKADYVGLSLSTTLQEHISVELGKTNAVYLS